MLLRQMRQKFGPPSPALRERILSADAVTLMAWSERLLGADSPETVIH